VQRTVTFWLAYPALMLLCLVGDEPHIHGLWRDLPFALFATAFVAAIIEWRLGRWGRKQAASPAPTN
jgi:hypothetical protein